MSVSPGIAPSAAEIERVRPFNHSHLTAIVSVAEPARKIETYASMNTASLPSSPGMMVIAMADIGGLIFYLKALAEVGWIQGTIEVWVEDKTVRIFADSLRLRLEDGPTADLLRQLINNTIDRAQVLAGRGIKLQVRCTYLPIP